SRPVAWRLPVPSTEPTRACTSTASARRPAWTTATAEPGADSPGTSMAVGSILARPWGPISNQAVSPSAPTRFLPLLRTRSPGRARQHDDGSGNEAATEDAVQPGHGSPDPRSVLAGIQRHRSDGIPSPAGRGAGRLVHRPPRGTPRAPARPLGQPLSTRRTDE